MSSRTISAEWDAQQYHRLSDPQYGWGREVLARLPLVGDERVIDAGCGSGRLTADLMERLPHGQVVAVDRSENMIAEARAHLTPRFGDRVSYLCRDLLELPALDADAIFSAATFHWIGDHQRLFDTLGAMLRPGGRLIAQCGGAGNVARLHGRVAAVMGSAAFAPYFGAWKDPWNFADPETTRARLEAAGFVEVETSLEPAPTRFADAETFRAFVAMAVLRVHLQYVTDPERRQQLLDAVTTAAAGDSPPYELDYVRLNIAAKKRG